MQNRILFEPVLIKEIPFEQTFNQISEEEYKSASIQFLTIFQYRDNTDVVGVHSVLRFITPNEKVIASGGVTIVASLHNWNEINKNEHDIKSAESVLSLLSYTHAVMTGVFYKQSDRTILQQAIIPCLSQQELANITRIEKVN